MTRNGKIARLPHDIREQVNRRLDDGEPGKDIAAWLNRLDQVKEVLRRHFDGSPINAQNLSDWKKGGYVDWQERDKTPDRLSELIDRSHDIEISGDGRQIAGHIATVLAAELASHTNELLEKSCDQKERWSLLCEAMRQLNILGRADLIHARAEMQRGRWKFEHEKLEREERKRLAREFLHRPALVKAFGGGEYGEFMADAMVGDDLEFSEFPKPAPTPAEQEPIKPDQGQSS